MVASAALSLSPQLAAQETGNSSLAVQEVARRQQALRDAMQQVQMGRTAYSAARYSEAVEHYRNALSVVPKASATEKQVQFIRQSLADALIAKGMDYRTVGRYDEAVSFFKEAAELDPSGKRAAAELARTQDVLRHNPALTPEHIGKVEEVNRLLTLGYGALDLGKYDEAEQTFKDVLRADAYNVAAQRGLEAARKRERAYYASARDSARARMLAEVDATWEEPLPAEEPRADVQTTEAGGVVHENAEMENSIADALKRMTLPQIEFSDASITEVVEALQGQVRRFENQGINAGRTINIVTRFGTPDSPSYKEVMSRRLNLKLNDVSVYELLDMLSGQLDISYYVTPMGVELSYSGKDFGPLVDRIYTVPPHFFDAEKSSGEEEDEYDDEESDFSGSSSRMVVTRVNPVERLKEMGISFPEGASARYDAQSRQLKVRNTMYNHQEIEGLVSVPISTDRSLVLNVIAMEVEEETLEELGFEWMFNFKLGPSFYGAGGEQAVSDAIGIPVVTTSYGDPTQTGLVTGGLRSGSSVLSADNMDTLIRNGRADAFNAASGGQKAPGIFGFRGIWKFGDMSMVMRGASQKKGVDILFNPRLVFSPGREEQVTFYNIKELFYPESYTEPQIQSMSFFLPGDGPAYRSVDHDWDDDGDDDRYGNAIIASPAHPDAFTRYAPTEEAANGIGAVLQVHSAQVAPDDQHVTMTLSMTTNEFEGFVNWGAPIQGMVTTGQKSEFMTLTKNYILKPVFKRRMEHTKVTIAPGAVIVMGGLKEARKVRYEDKLPVLGDLPMVGRLFRSEGEDMIRKAYIVFIKVDVVDPSGRDVRTGEAPEKIGA